jgi:hypothetical protein
MMLANFDRDWADKVLPKTSSSMSIMSDTDSEKASNKQQSSLFIHKLYGKCSDSILGSLD